VRKITHRSRLRVVAVAVLLTATLSVFLHAAPQQKPETPSRPATSPDAAGSGLSFDLAQGRQAGTPDAEAAAKIPSIEEKTARLQKLDGYFPLYWDEAAGTLWMEIPKLDTEVLYINGLSAGIGSNDIGLDRGQLGATRLVLFERIGRKVLMIQPNYRFRATSGNPDEERAVRESFATSVIWGFTVAAETGGRVLVDLTDFLLRDATGVANRLRPATFRVDRTRSAVHMPRTKAFSKNTEMDVTLTFTAEGSTANAGGGFERGALSYVAPAADAVTVRQHHSFVELPDGNFKPRRFDPRGGFNQFSYEDYSAPLGTETTRRFITRHRLQKKDPTAKISDPVKPIVYYLDRAAPEPIRSALLEGGRWWNQAFEAAGFRNAFRVELMPEGADPMDVRYDSSRGYISVMDYPQPLATLRPDGTVDLSQAYGVGIGDWDKVTIAWGYSEFPPGTDENKALDQILSDAWEKDLRFLSNQDADYNPRVDQWANGTDPAAELNRMMDVRRAVLERFGENVVKTGEPLALIEEPFVPMYLYHRYQVEAAASALGGLNYFYTVRGGGQAHPSAAAAPGTPRQQPWSFTPAAEQRAALEALMRTLAPSELVVPDPILKQLPPRPDGYRLNREIFPRNTGLPFDALTPAIVASDLTVSFILRPDRAGRLVNQHALDPSLPGLEEVIDRLIKAGFDTPAATPYEAEVRRTIGRVIVERLIALAATSPMAQVRAIASQRLQGLRSRFAKFRTAEDWPMEQLMAADIARFLERPAEPYKPVPFPSAPPGAPIGEPGYQWLPPYGTGTMWWEWWEWWDGQN
jgi:hypothetical protein